MSRISRKALATAIIKVQAMNLKEKEQLADEIHLQQPHMLGSCLVQERFGVSLAKTDVLINIILVCYQAMKESKLSWPLITEDDQDRQLTRYTALVKFAEDLKGQLREQSITGYLEAHPEKELFAYVNSELVGWLKSVVPEQSDKYVMLAAMNIVNCIAYVPMPELNNEYERDL